VLDWEGVAGKTPNPDTLFLNPAKLGAVNNKQTSLTNCTALA